MIVNASISSRSNSISYAFVKVPNRTAEALPNAREEERIEGRVRTMLLLAPSVLAIRLGSLSLRSRLTF